jgi:MFS family permease
VHPINSKAQPGLLMAMICILEVVFALCWASLPALMPVIAVDLSISHTMGGFIWGLLRLGVAIASPIGGVAVDRYGQRRVLGLALIVAGLATAGRSMAPDAWFLAFLMFLFGLSVGFLTPSIPKAIAGHMKPEHIGRANGATFLSLTFGNALTILTAATVLAPLFGGWRSLMAIAGAAIALIGILWLLMVKDRIPPSEGTSIRQVINMGKDGQMVRVTLIQTMQFGGYVVMLGILPRALTESGLSPAIVGEAVALWLAVLGLFNIVGPWLSDLKGERRPFVLIGALLAGAGLLVMAFSPSWSYLWLLIVIAIGNGCFGPILVTIPIEMPSIGPAKVGAAIGFIFTFGQIGAFLLSTFTGIAAESGGLAAALVTLAAVHFIIIIPFRGLMETGRRGGTAKFMPEAAT